MQTSQDYPWPDAPPEPVFTRHAAVRMAERGVSLLDVRATLRAPFLVLSRPVARCIRFVASVIRGARREWLVVVVAAATGHVVTVYWRSGRTTPGRCNSNTPRAPRSVHNEEADNGAA